MPATRATREKAAAIAGSAVATVPRAVTSAGSADRPAVRVAPAALADPIPAAPARAVPVPGPAGTVGLAATVDPVPVVPAAADRAVVPDARVLPGILLASRGGTAGTVGVVAPISTRSR